MDIVDALRRSGERALAVRLARKHGNDCHLTHWLCLGQFKYSNLPSYMH